MKKLTIYISFLFFIGCNNTNGILPESNLILLDSYHCWPYEVKVYSVDKVKVDSLFYTYPLKSYFSDNANYKTSFWRKYRYLEIDTSVWYGMNKTLKQCDDNTELYNQMLKGDDIYYSGSYLYFQDKKGKEKRRYEKILFLNLSNNKLHIFNDINKVY